MYDRLMEFANSAPDNEKLYGWDDEHSTIVQAIREARDKVEHFKEYQGFTGQAGQAMSDEAVRAIKRFDKQANYYMTGMSYYVEARRAIMLTAEDARQLSPTLLDPMTESLRHAGMVTIPSRQGSACPANSSTPWWRTGWLTWRVSRPRRMRSARRRQRRLSSASSRR